MKINNGIYEIVTQLFFKIHNMHLIEAFDIQNKEKEGVIILWHFKNIVSISPKSSKIEKVLTFFLSWIIYVRMLSFVYVCKSAFSIRMYMYIELFAQQYMSKTKFYYAIYLNKKLSL